MAKATAIKPPPSVEPVPSVLSPIPAWRRQDWKGDPESVLDARLEQLRGLASCLTVLGRADRTREVVDELIDDALPMLGSVMQLLSMDAIRARDAIELKRGQTFSKEGLGNLLSEARDG